jgi:hypothetical protein
MMIRLAEDIEQILDNNEEDRTADWMELMLKNSRLIMFDDNYIYYYDEIAFEDIRNKLDEIIYRTYPIHGEGSFFPTQRDVDMRRVELWHQANWYIVDNDIH